MSIFVLADLHLSTDSKTNKSMEVFGARWQDYISKIKKNWNAVVGENDTVIVPGDISWATRLEEAESDLLFLESLNGHKLIGKGNHDFWWTTASKMKAFFEEKKISSVSILYNNAYIIEDRIICGTRGWFPDEGRQVTVGDVDHAKILNREVTRLKLSLDAAKKLRSEHETVSGEKLPISVFLHFPPVWCDFAMTELITPLQEYGVSECYFGHIHNAYNQISRFEHEGIKMILCSSDHLNFYPLKI